MRGRRVGALRRWLVGLTCGLAAPLVASGATPASPSAPVSVAAPTVILRDGWAIHPAAGLDATGAELSKAGYQGEGWTATAVPSTPLAALVRGGEVRDPYFGN